MKGVTRVTAALPPRLLVHGQEGVTKQPDLFGTAPAPPDPLIGLAVRLTGLRCRCGSRLAVIAAGAGPHAASLECSRCETFRGWLPKATHDFLTEIVRNFGRPTTPIRVGHGSRAKTSTDQQQKGEAQHFKATQTSGTN
jgi:hypothetical protein